MALETTRLPPIVPNRAKVKLRGKNTVVHPFDPVDTNASVWFPSAIGKSSVRTPNEVIPYIDGHPAFKDMVAAMRTATKPGHFIYLLGWRLMTDFELIPGDKTSTTESLFTKASALNVDIRVMLHRHVTELSHQDNTPTINFVNGLAKGAAIHDDRVVSGGFLVHLKAPYLGVHHQKVLVVNGSEGLVAFQGGMDINPDRLHFDEPTKGLHDVHFRHRGLAAADLWTLFVERWKDHPQSTKFSPIPAQVTDTANVTDTLQVEVGRTFPNSTSHTLFGPGGPYHFAAAGDRSAKSLVLNAIAQSRKFIYIEDQFPVDMSISHALKAALPNLKKLIILITDSRQILEELQQPFQRRKEFIDNLTGGVQPPTDKLIVCMNVGGYVHSKTFIFDDKFVITGSANLSRRGYSHDSEQNAGVFDTNARKRFFFAHELRMNLWAKHLGKRPIDLVDPIASSVHFTTPIGKIATYVLTGTDFPKPGPFFVSTSTPSTLPMSSRSSASAPPRSPRTAARKPVWSWTASPWRAVAIFPRPVRQPKGATPTTSTRSPPWASTAAPSMASSAKRVSARSRTSSAPTRGSRPTEPSTPTQGLSGRRGPRGYRRGSLPVHSEQPRLWFGHHRRTGGQEDPPCGHPLSGGQRVATRGCPRRPRCS